MPGFGLDGVSSSLAESMSIIFPTCFPTVVFYVRNPDTTDNRQHTSSAGCVLQHVGYIYSRGGSNNTGVR